MDRIVSTFEHLRRSGRTALMPYLTMGYPRLESALALVPALVEAGADLIELGVPFSDPLADGATIQAAGQQALANGMTLSLCLEQAATLRSRGVSVPLVLMGYYNPILQLGLESFARRAAGAGIDGLIVPDLPPEEADPLQSALQARRIAQIFLSPRPATRGVFSSWPGVAADSSISSHGKKPGCPPSLWLGRNGKQGFGGSSPRGLFPWKKPRPVAGVLH